MKNKCEPAPFCEAIDRAMKNADKGLSNDPETRDRYGKATRGGKAWMCFVKWIAEDRARWDDVEVIHYRDMLADWLTVTDIAYVLQFEINTHIVDFLKKQLLKILEWETTPRRLEVKQVWQKMGLHRKTYDGRTVLGIAQEKAGAGLGRNMRISAMREVAAYLKGESFGASYWAHPGHSNYIAWHNQYLAPLTGLYKVQ